MIKERRPCGACCPTQETDGAPEKSFQRQHDSKRKAMNTHPIPFHSSYKNLTHRLLQSTAHWQTTTNHTTQNSWKFMEHENRPSKIHTLELKYYHWIQKQGVLSNRISFYCNCWMHLNFFLLILFRKSERYIHMTLYPHMGACTHILVK